MKVRNSLKSLRDRHQKNHRSRRGRLYVINKVNKRLRRVRVNLVCWPRPECRGTGGFIFQFTIPTLLLGFLVLWPHDARLRQLINSNCQKLAPMFPFRQRICIIWKQARIKSPMTGLHNSSARVQWLILRHDGNAGLQAGITISRIVFRSTRYCQQPQPNFKSRHVRPAPSGRCYLCSGRHAWA